MLKKTIFSFCLLSLLSTTTSANATTLSNQEYKKALEKEAEIYDIQISIDSYPVMITYKVPTVQATGNKMYC